MTRLSCLMIAGLLVATRDEPDAASLVRRLGSDRFVERVEATRGLEKLGSAAKPALLEARNSANPRVRDRAEAILKTLDRTSELDRLTRPTLIKLDFRDQPLSQVIDSLNVRHHLNLTLQFGPVQNHHFRFGGIDSEESQQVAELKAKPITLVAPEPLPFWEAIDRLCRVADLQHDLAPQAGFGLPVGRFLLFSGLKGSPRTSDSGPIRVAVAGLHSTFERDFFGAADPPFEPPRAPGRSQGDRDLVVRMVVIPQPGLMVRRVGPIQFAEAIDDQGRDLIPPPKPPPGPAGFTTNFDPNSGALNGSSSFDLDAQLRLVDQTGRSIRRVRGLIPVVVLAEAPNPMVIPLNPGVVGKSSRDDEVSVSILEIARDADAGVTVEVEVTPHRAEARDPVQGDRKSPTDLASFRTDQLMNRLELIDADGRELTLDWTQPQVGDWTTARRRIRLTPRVIYDQPPRDLAGNLPERIPRWPVPVELRYHRFIQTLIEIPFDFRDLPLP